jgi:co-chaperonin GroES (HSP10)
MISTLTELKCYRPTNNYVVIKPEPVDDRFKVGSLFLINPKWDEFKNQPIICKVISTPKKLLFGTRKEYVESVEELDMTSEQKMLLAAARKEAKFSETTLVEKPIPGSMMWNTPMELKSDDIVWVNANALMVANRENNTIEIEGEKYYLLKYSEIYLKKAGGEVKMLNGWVLAELIEDTPEWQKKAVSIGLIIPEIMKNLKNNDRFAVIKYIGDPVEYIFDDTYDFPQVKAGDIVMLKWKVNRRLEPGQKYFGKDSDLIVTRRSRVLAIMQ